MQNKNTRIIIVLFILIIKLASLFGQEKFQIIENTKEVKDKIKIMAEKTQTIESDFTQEKHLSMLEETIISKGYFCYKKENKIIN